MDSGFGLRRPRSEGDDESCRNIRSLISGSPCDDARQACGDLGFGIAEARRVGDAGKADRDVDGAGAPFTVVGVTPSRNGATAISANGDVVYAPYPDYSGADSFFYWVRSSSGRVGKAKVTITVQ